MKFSEKGHIFKILVFHDNFWNIWIISEKIWLVETLFLGESFHLSQ